MRTLCPDQAIGLLPPGAGIVAGAGCGTPTTMLRALHVAAPDLPLPPVLYSGILLGELDFLDSVARGHLRYLTWHPYGPVLPALARNEVEYLPARCSSIADTLARRRVDTAFARVTPPDRHGYVSLGPSASYIHDAVTQCRVVIGEVDERLPRTRGQSTIHVSRFAAFVTSEDPTPMYLAREPDSVSTAIAGLLLGHLPDRPILQLGIGAVPEAVASGLLDHPGPVRFVGMATDRMVDLAERGVISPDHVLPTPGIVAAELMGGPRLMQFAHDNPRLAVYPSSTSHSVPVLAGLPGFVSILSAAEIDLRGQVSSERVAGRQLSGVGGSIDYAESSRWSPGGLTVIALPATAAGGARSRIVSQLPEGAVVSLHHQAADLVVTEHGVADLRGRTEAERSDLLTAIAAPPFQADLEAGRKFKQSVD